MLQPEHADEPVFLLRAQDELSVAALMKWIKDAQGRGVPEAKLVAAIDHLRDFCHWRQDHPERVKLPD